MSYPSKLIKRLTIAALLLVPFVGMTAEASNISYAVNETINGPLNGLAGNPSQTDSVVGTITTDGTIGVLHASNLVSWDLNLIDVNNPQYSYDLKNGPGTVNSLVSVDNGSVLNATATGLFFNFNGTGAFAFQATSPGAYSGYHYWCLSQGWYGCLDGNSIAPGNVYPGYPGDDLVVAATGTQGQVGNSPLNPVPEPETYAMMMAGLGLMGFVVRRRKQG